MKRPKSLTFSAPKQIIQVFRWHSVLDKEAYRNPKTAIERRQVWQQPVLSASGMVEQGELILPEIITAHVDFDRADILLLDDQTDRSVVRCLSVRNARRTYDELFRIGMNPDDEHYWLSFRYPGALSMGYPTRTDFDLSPLRPGHPVQVLVNGRTWHSLTWGRPTKYREWNYVFQPLGEFDRCMLRSQIETTKVVPDAKVIDLRKELY